MKITILLEIMQFDIIVIYRQLTYFFIFLNIIIDLVLKFINLLM